MRDDISYIVKRKTVPFQYLHGIPANCSYCKFESILSAHMNAGLSFLSPLIVRGAAYGLGNINDVEPAFYIKNCVNISIAFA